MGCRWLQYLVGITTFRRLAAPLINRCRYRYEVPTYPRYGAGQTGLPEAAMQLVGRQHTKERIDTTRLSRCRQRNEWEALSRQTITVIDRYVGRSERQRTSGRTPHLFWSVPAHTCMIAPTFSHLKAYPIYQTIISNCFGISSISPILSFSPRPSCNHLYAHTRASVLCCNTAKRARDLLFIVDFFIEIESSDKKAYLPITSYNILPVFLGIIISRDCNPLRSTSPHIGSLTPPLPIYRLQKPAAETAVLAGNRGT
ncbi:hypothetical protein F4861DRAFT_50493 [Xylaria intraflava]|nr:hypothetical protein F4861DRAFT_50493 [Xylaria intraflava]